MDKRLVFTKNEKTEILTIIRRLRVCMDGMLAEGDEMKVLRHLKRALADNNMQRDVFGINPVLHSMQTALIATDELGLKRDSVLAILLYASVTDDESSSNTIECTFGKDVARIIHGLKSIQALYKKNPVIESENFRNLLLSFAEDMRVILIMIADRVNLMRQIRDTENTEAKMRVSEEASYLYAPIAHKLGLYKLKSELEDLSLKYLEHDAYYMIKAKLNATKKSRDAYIERFITPIDKKLKEAGLKFHMKAGQRAYTASGRK